MFWSSGCLNADYSQPKYNELEKAFPKFKMLTIRDLINSKSDSQKPFSLQKSKQLLETAKIAVERAIESKETMATA